MQGLEVARRFYLEWGAPYLHDRFPDLASSNRTGHPHSLFRDLQALRARIDEEALARTSQQD